jgi:hypothetical protein
LEPQMAPSDEIEPISDAENDGRTNTKRGLRA